MPDRRCETLKRRCNPDILRDCVAELVIGSVRGPHRASAMGCPGFAPDPLARKDDLTQNHPPALDAVLGATTPLQSFVEETRLCQMS